jgi:putative Holliday junction resolvase
MARLMGIDYGTKRTGLAVTDPLQIIASPLETVPTNALMDFLKNYVATEPVERFVVGEPLQDNERESHSTKAIQAFVQQLAKQFPHIPITLVDESFTSQKAAQALVLSGLKKKKRQEKGMLDKVSAALILQLYMETNPL